jgi:hypothetical protein
MSCSGEGVKCPICNKEYPVTEIENHANKCIFLSSGENDAVSSKRGGDHKQTSPAAKRQKSDGYVDQDHVRQCRNVRNEQYVNG